MLDTWILAWAHIVSAMGWLGGGILFGFVLSPALQRLSPQSSGEFMVKVVPSVVRFLQAVAGLTIVFGILLLYNMGGLALLDPSTFYGVALSAGVGLALVAFLVTEFVTAPTQLKAVRMIRDMQAAGQQHPPELFPRTMMLVRMTATLSLVLLLAASVCMVGAGFY